MIKIINKGIYLINGKSIIEDTNENELKKAFNILKNENKDINKYDINIQKAKTNSIAYQILKNHNTSNNINKLKLKFDTLASHDITYVGIIQTARACG